MAAYPRFTSPNTPESLLPRTDSKNPARTCQGMTANGRRCRRDIGLSGPSSPAGSRRASAPTASSDPSAMFCWQHKDQAPSPLAGTGSQSRPLKERASEDTLLRRFGGLSLEDDKRRRRPKKPRPKPKKSTWGMLCCMIAHDDSEEERMEVVVRKRQPSQYPKITQRPPAAKAHSDSHLSSTTFATAALMQLIPSATDPQTTSLLLAELAKPLSQTDEPGYIYVFILTDSATPQPRESDTASLLASSTPAADGIARSLSTRGPSDKRKLLVKIGRAVNVHRRMEQWQRQCGYNITLVRFYPYVSRSARSPPPTSTPAASSPRPRPASRRASTPGDSELSQGIRQVPYSHRVERLIHVELRGQRARMGACEACGREHREWFTVEASRRGIGFVDSVVKRWVTWAEGVDSSKVVPM